MRPGETYLTENKNRKNGSFRKKVITAGLGILFLVLLISSFFGKKGLIEIHQARKTYRTLLQQIEILEGEKRRLEREIEELRNNPKAVEVEARERLWLMAPDEKVIVRKPQPDPKKDDRH